MIGKKLYFTAVVIAFADFFTAPSEEDSNFAITTNSIINNGFTGVGHGVYQSFWTGAAYELIDQTNTKIPLSTCGLGITIEIPNDLAFSIYTVFFRPFWGHFLIGI